MINHHFQKSLMLEYMKKMSEELPLKSNKRNLLKMIKKIGRMPIELIISINLIKFYLSRNNIL